MATLDETNIFGLTPNQPEKKDDSLSRLGISESGYLNRLAQIQNMQKVAEGVKEKSEKKYGLGIPLSQRSIERSDLIKQYTSDLAEAAKDPTQEKRDTALESFFETPFMFQMGQYIPDPTGLPTDIAEAEYSGRKFKESREARGKGTEFYPGPLGMGDRPYYPDMTPEEAGLKLQQGLAIGSIPPGIGGIAGIAQSIFGLPSKVLRSKTMDGQGGGSGGISEIPPEPKKDYAGFVSSVEKVALGPQKFGSGQDLINFIESPKRSGISKKELEYIDFDQIRNNPDLTKEDVIKYIQDNRPNIYRVQRVEDNPTYRADESDNPLTFLPFNEEATTIANREQQDFFRDEYAQELAQHNEIITDNQTLRYSNYRLNSENINDPSVLEAVDNYLKYDPEAFNGVNPAVIQINYPDGKVAFFNNDDFVSGNNPEVSGYTTKDLEKVVKDGATIRFPALAQTDDIIEEASAMRVSPDFGNEIEVYESVGENTGTNYKIIGTEDTGYRVMIDDAPATGDLGTSTNQQERFYDDLADARARVQAEAFDNADIVEGANTFDTGINAEQLLESAPFDVITGEATLPTRFGYQYDDYRLPMGGAENYREFTLHIANPKTATRYDSTKGTKHFGGGDELLHYRTTDRIDEDGKKVLFVEEIQSDLHSTASSTKESQNYEIGPDTKKQAVKELRDIFKDNKNIRVADDGDIIKLDADSTYDTTNMLTAEEVSNVNTFKDVTNFGSNINLRKLNVLSDAEIKGLKKFREKYGKDEQVLPDYPYKGNDYIELAVKDIMKLASEGDYDRVAFTNAPTQINRNQKRLNFITDIGLQRVPSIEEYEKSNQFKADVDKNLETRFLDEKSLVESEFMNVFTNNYPNKEAWFADHPSVKNDIELVTKARWAEQNTEGDFILTKKGLGNLQNEDVYKSPEQLLEMIKQNPDKQVGAMPIRGKNIDDLLKELNMPLGDVKKQIMADIKAGNIPSSVDDGQIYELNIKEGSGKKYLDMYGKIIPQQLKKIAQKYDKNAKPQLKRVLYNENLEDVSPDILYEVYKGRLGGDDQKMLSEGLKAHEAATIDITPEMRKAILTEGVNVMYKGGIVNKVKSMDKPIQGNRREI